MPDLLLPFADAAPPLPEGEFLFASPYWLWALLPLAALFFLRRRTGNAGSVVYPTMRFIGHYLTPPRTLAGKLGPVLLTLASLFLVLALARPQWKQENTSREVSGIDIIVAFDVSGSMVTTQDMVTETHSPSGNPVRLLITRLRAAKLVIDQFIERRPNDRIGLVAFAGKTKTSCPLTLDHDIVRRIVEGLDTRYVGTDGTAIGSAIAAAASRLEARKDTKSKIIILVTDGASNAGTLNPIDAAKAAAKLGIRIYTIAIGTEDNRISQYTTDIDLFDEKTLKEIARLTGGEHFRARNSRLLDNSFRTIDKLEKTEARQRTIVRYDELFPYPLAAAALLLLAGLALPLAFPRPAP